MGLPFDPSQPERRPNRVVFYTDVDTAKWLDDVATEHDLDQSLVLHRIVKQARDSASGTERRHIERRLA